MLEFQGKYGKASVYIDNIDQQTISQIYSFLNHEAFANPISIMPDCHAGNGAVIGFTMEMVPDKIIPNIVGVDINCGMYSMNIGNILFPKFTKEELNSKIRNLIPFGTNIHKRSPVIEDTFWPIVNMNHRTFIMKLNKKYEKSYSPIEFTPQWFENKCKDIGMDYDRAIKSIGTLGGGNHFIEISQSKNTNDDWVTIHSGSRQFGLKIATYWQRKAGKGDLSYLSGDDTFGYLTDVIFTQKYAEFNRLHMAHLILQACELDYKNVKEVITTNHNFIDFDDFIIRKGAIKSYIGQKMIIPFNMEDGILICEGKSNPEWNYSAPHGAGRVGSRRWAKENLSLNEASTRMKEKGIFSSSLPTDELKGAYKDPAIIEAAIEPTATILDRLIPIISMKG